MSELEVPNLPSASPVSRALEAQTRIRCRLFCGLYTCNFAPEKEPHVNAWPEFGDV